MPINDAKIILFARAPVKGQVKTRLAVSVGEDVALGIYVEMLELTFRAVLATGFRVSAFVDEPENSYFAKWQQQGVKLFSQSGADLGQRMYDALVHQQRKNGPVLLLGSDCPQISSTLINRVVHLLASQNEVVIVPSNDGGYVLIAFASKVRKELFEDISWSTDRVLEQTIAKLKMLSLSYHLLEPLLDIDTVEDYQYWLSISQ